MQLLFDTHTFIWWDSDPGSLSQNVLDLCTNPNNTLIVSTVSLWEIQIKHQLGKLSLNRPLPEIVQNQQERNEISILPIRPGHIYELEKLPDHHHDPFDRLLVAQAQVEQCVLLSKDPKVAAYPVQVLW
ncbi:MAG: type II toxin-antitoxin system VapC family toxin [Anaerolineae bacterium]|nr:type II toxin-antitoxin system VapC family toxin [Anaerolineae bacterium]